MKLIKDNEWGDGGWFMKRLKNHIKICNKDYTQHFRFSLDEWDIVKEQFIRELKKLRHD